MWYLYILESLKNHYLYVGITSSVIRRLREHNDGIGGAYTSKNRPFKLIFYEAYLDKRDAMEAERFFKSGYGREVLKDKLKHYFSDNRNR